MTTEIYDSGRDPLGRTLYDITQLLESAEGAEERVRRVLELLRGLVPYQQCALLEARLGQEPRVTVLPELPPEERVLLTGRLVDIFGQFVDANTRSNGQPTRSKGEHLAVPLVGMDEVIGLLFVQSLEVEHTVDHLRALSVVAANLAAYLTMLSARVELAALARERGEARRAAEAANRAKDEFLALVSTELKTPLSSILGWTHSLRASADDPIARARAIAELEGNVHKQTSLIDGILDLACIAAADLRLNLRTVEPAVLIKDTIEALRLEGERKAIRIEAALETEAMPLVLDPARISQVVSILVGNAINFTPEGGQVDVRLERAAGYARIQVTDSGSGISREALPHAFERFPQPAALGTRIDGAGLAVVKDLVELHGGRVRVQSPGPEQGATFTVELPCVRGTVPEAGLPQIETPDGQLAGVRILLVDDDPGLRESLQLVLEDYGAEVSAVASALDALAVLERSRPDVLLFGDLATRGEGVYDLMKEVAERAAPLPLASLTSWRVEARERERAAGFQVHLSKPIQIGTLIDAVVDLAGRKPAKAPPSLAPAR